MKEYILFMFIFLLLDSLYIYALKDSHLETIKNVQSSSLQPRIIPAILFYLMVPIAYVYIINPLAKGDTTKRIFYSGLLGMLMYATFDLTNLALFKGFTVKYAVTDIIWGITNMILSAFIVSRLVK